MSILITGGAGMLGLALCRRLSNPREGDYVFILDDFSRDVRSKSDRLVEASMYEAGIDKFHIADDEGSIEWLERYMLAKNVDTVINCAADVGGVHYNRDNGASIFSRNAMLQSIPLLAAQRAGVQNYIGISSVCVYEPTVGLVGEAGVAAHVHQENVPLGELSLDNGGYALAKRAGETLAFASDIEYVTIVRPTNMFGPFDYYDAKSHVIPAMIRQALDDDVEEITVRAHPGVERDFLYVDGAAEMIASLLAIPPLMRDREIFNLPASPGGRVTLFELADSVAQYAKTDKKIQYVYNVDEITEISRRVSGAKLYEAVYHADKEIGDLTPFHIALARTIDTVAESML